MALKWFQNVCVCVCVDGMNVKHALRGHIHVSVHSVLCQCHKHTHTRILKPFEDNQPTGLKVDIAEACSILLRSGLLQALTYGTFEQLWVLNGGDLNFCVRWVHVHAVTASCFLSVGTDTDSSSPWTGTTSTGFTSSNR